MNTITEKFKKAWLNMDIQSINDCISDNVTYSALPSENSFTCRNKVIDHLTKMFRFLKENNAESLELYKNATYRSFSFNITYESLRPITQYLINSEGIFLVPCLEPRFTTMAVEVSVIIRKDKISKIKIFQKNKIECRKTA
jgi:hypothetical protein